MIYIDSDVSNRADSLSQDQINRVLYQMYFTAQNMAVVAMNRRQFDLSEGHCQQCLACSRRFGVEGEIKIDMIFTALRTSCDLRIRQGDYTDALTCAEEGYNLLVVAYDPAHPQVQTAAGILIDILIEKGDL